MDPKFLQRWADLCAEPKLATIQWIVCELFLVHNKGSREMNNAFPHRSNRLQLHYIIGGSENRERTAATNFM